MQKNEDKIIDDLFREYFNKLKCAKDSELLGIYNRFQNQIFNRSLSLMTCLWSTEIIQGIIEDMDDEYIGSSFENEIWGDRDNIIDRFKKLRKSFIKKKSSDKVRDMLSEATRCYVYGFNQATIALCRAALDYLLKEKLRKKAEDKCELSDLIREARNKRILSTDAIRKKAWNVLENGNNVMHTRPFPFNSLNIINDTKEVLENILESRKG